MWPHNIASFWYHTSSEICKNFIVWVAIRRGALYQSDLYHAFLDTQSGSPGIQLLGSDAIRNTWVLVITLFNGFNYYIGTYWAWMIAGLNCTELTFLNHV